MESQDYQARLTDLTARFMEQNLRIIERYGELVTRLASGQASGAHLTSQVTGFARSAGSDFMRDLMQLNINYYSLLVDMSADFTNRLFDAMLSTGQPRAASAASTAPPTAPPAPARAPSGMRFELAFSGLVGETVSSPFVVQNKKEQTTNVAFEITEFISENGATRFRSSVEFVPSEFTLEPGAERVVECRIRLTPSFVPGQRYMALVRVLNFPGMDIGLVVTPQSADVAEGARSGSNASASGAKKEESGEQAPAKPRRRKAPGRPATDTSAGGAEA